MNATRKLPLRLVEQRARDTGLNDLIDNVSNARAMAGILHIVRHASSRTRHASQERIVATSASA